MTCYVLLVTSIFLLYYIENMIVCERKLYTYSATYFNFIQVVLSLSFVCVVQRSEKAWTDFIQNYWALVFSFLLLVTSTESLRVGIVSNFALV